MGSFLWKLSDGSSISIIKRSQCDMCSHILARYELIPILSRVMQGGRCRRCKYTLSTDYLLSELLSGLAFAVIGYVARIFPIIIQLQIAIIISLLLYLCFYDVRKKELSMVAFIFLCISIIGLYLSYFSRSSDAYGSRVSLRYIPYEHYFSLMNQICLAVGTWGGVRFLVRLLGVGIYYNKHGVLGQGLGFGDVLFAGILGGLLPFVMIIMAMFVGGAIGLRIENYYMRYGILIIYHIFFSSILGIIGYSVLKKSEFAFLPYMLGGFLFLAIAIFTFPNYFIALLAG